MLYMCAVSRLLTFTSQNFKQLLRRATETLSVPVRGDAAVNETGLYIKMCLEGYGLAQLAEAIVSEHLREGRLIEVLADWQPSPVPVTLLYPHQRFLSPAVRSFADWMAGLIGNVSLSLP